MYKKLQGLRFGRLKVFAFHGVNYNREKTWFCECDCGSLCIKSSRSLLSGRSNSCGCINREYLSQTRGIHFSKNERLYHIWKHMRQRCKNKNDFKYKDYGGRGIVFCEEWNNYIMFRDWSIKNGYNKNLSIDRINNNGNYEPSNCKWSTPKEQANNTRRNTNITIGGKTQTLSMWCDELNASRWAVKRMSDDFSRKEEV